MSMTSKTSKWTQKLNFNTAAACFEKLETVMSRLQLELLLKFSMQIDFHIVNCGTSPKRKPEVDLQCCGRHLGNGYDVITHNLAADDPIWTKFDKPMENRMPMMTEMSKWNRK